MQTLYILVAKLLVAKLLVQNLCPDLCEGIEATQNDEHGRSLCLLIRGRGFVLGILQELFQKNILSMVE